MYILLLPVLPPKILALSLRCYNAITLPCYKLDSVFISITDRAMTFHSVRVPSFRLWFLSEAWTCLGCSFHLVKWVQLFGCYS